MKRITGGIAAVIIGVMMMVYSISSSGEADYLTTRGGFILGFVLIVGGGYTVLSSFKTKF